ncbi:hypothetical protein OCC_10780 [Thermococcus litoralis DSM 5473]|uniref:Uncharacterized protein n=1 Tax=Thermococcus litoralis (strain ATCC 51850 / DSM 5473 / JCM 8560 / NS-C) TaxID=523849 RepID=H3ZR06_THELN|nr:hypothetical protein [Thermococcus litoralis]EHR77582.1 hypothetical protein OCC_10780 [Thermococcus litoralis DSM 5473]
MRRRIMLIFGLMLLVLVGVSLIFDDFGHHETSETSIEHMSKVLIDQLETLNTLVSQNGPLLSPEEIRDYQVAEHFHEEALKMYELGDYNNSIRYSLKAMEYYKKILEKRTFQEQEEPLHVDVVRLRDIINRDTLYFLSVKNVIQIGKESGIDVSKLEALYNETVKAYTIVLEDIEFERWEKLSEDWQYAVEKRIQLDNELRKTLDELLKARAEDFVPLVLERYSQLLEIGNKTIQEAKRRGLDTSRAEYLFNLANTSYLKIKELAAEKRWEEAVEAIKRNQALFFEMRREIITLLKSMEG